VVFETAPLRSTGFCLVLGSAPGACATKLVTVPSPVQRLLPAPPGPPLVFFVTSQLEQLSRRGCLRPVFKGGALYSYTVFFRT